jgi:hypothetical protein
MANLERLEFWSDVEPAGGIRVAFVGEWISCTEQVTLDGNDTMILGLHRDNAALVTVSTAAGATNGEPNRVLRAALSDGSIVERRIVSIEEKDDAGQLTVVLEARGLMFDLSNRGLVSRLHSNNTLTHTFRASSLTLQQHLELYVLPALAEAGEGWWAVGTLESTAAITVDYDKDSPLSALRKLASNSGTQLELGVRFDRAAKLYRIDLVRRLGASASVVRVNSRLNLLSFGLRRSAEDVANRIYAFGATDEQRGIGTMGDNLWLGGTLIQVSTTPVRYALTVTDPAGGPGPIAFAGQYAPNSKDAYQLIGHALGSQQYDIYDSDEETQTFTVGIRQSGTQGGYLKLLRNMAELTYLETPDAIDGPLGIRVGAVEREEVPGVRNLVDNPIQRVWPTGVNLPTGWVSGGGTGMTLFHNTSPLFWRTAGQSLLITWAAGSEDIVVARVMTNLLPLAGLMSFFVDVLTISGAVNVEFEAFFATGRPTPDGGGVWFSALYPLALQFFDPSLAAAPLLGTTQLGVWERIGLDGCHDITRYPAIEVLVRLKSRGLVATSCVVDCAQITNTARNAELVEGSGANILMAAANERLRLYGELATSISLRSLDLTTIDDEQFPFNDYVLGGGILLVNQELGQALQTRVLGWSRDYMRPADIQVQISQAAPDITRIMAQRTPSAVPSVLR